MSCSQCLRAEEQGWCSFPISVQHTDWETGIARAKDQSQSPETLNFGDGTDIVLVDQGKGVVNAIKRVKDSMQVGHTQVFSPRIIAVHGNIEQDVF